MTRTCSRCPTELGRRNKSGLCRPCLGRLNLTNPAAQAKAHAGLRRYFKDPAARAARGAESQERLKAWRSTPEGAAKHLEQAQKNLQLAHEGQGAERRKRGIRAAAYPGIPEHRWDECARLAKSFGAAEAKRIIRDDEAAIEKARVAGLSPFERQLEWVRNGGKLVAKLDLRKPEASYTMGGVASGML